MPIKSKVDSLPCSHYGIIHNRYRNKQPTTMYNNMDKSHKHNIEQKETRHKRVYILYDYTYIN